MKKFFRKLGTFSLGAAAALFFSIPLFIGIAQATDTFYSVWPFWSVDTTTPTIGYFNGTLFQLGALTTTVGGTGNPAHLSSAQTTTPSLGATCGTTPAIIGTDFSGQITAGTGTPTSCTLTFNVAFTGTPVCVVTWKTGPLAAMSWVEAPTTLTITQTATSSDKITYICTGPAGG